MPIRRTLPAFGADPLDAQRFRTQRAEEPEDLWQPLYDRVNIATTVPSQVSFFSVPKGQSATLITGSAAGTVIKSYRDTNIETAGVVPSKLYKLGGISIAFVHASRQATTNAADRTLIQDGGYLQFRIVDKDILFIPLICIPVLNPISAVTTTATATTIMSMDGGGGLGVPMYKFPIPITINPFDSFSLTANFTTSPNAITLSNTLDMYVILHAYMRRPT